MNIGHSFISFMFVSNKSMFYRPHVVKLDWLAASIKQKGAADEEQYTYLDFGKTVPEPPSPLSQKVSELLFIMDRDTWLCQYTHTHTHTCLLYTSRCV